MLHSSWIQPTWCFKQGITLKQPFIYSMTQFPNLPYAFHIPILVPVLSTIVITVVIAHETLASPSWITASLISQGYRSVILAFSPLFQQHTKKAIVDNEHQDSPQFFLLKRYSSWLLSDLFIIKGRHTQKIPFCTCNQGPVSFKTAPLSFCKCGGRNSNLAFCPQENREQAEHGILCRMPCTLTRCGLEKKLHWAYGFERGWQVSCVTARSECHRQTARPNCGTLSTPVGHTGQQHILIAC